MNRSALRLSAAACAASLLVAGAIAPSRPAGACCGISMPAGSYSTCGIRVQQGGGSTAFVSGVNAGVTQPINVNGNVSACSLTVQRDTYYGQAAMKVLQWDPLALAPDPTTLAYRTVTYDASYLYYTSNHYRADLYPPVVVKTINGVADGRPASLAMDFQGTDGYTSRTLTYDPDGASGVPTAYQYSPGGPRTPLTGNHPVLSHAVCGGDEFLQGLCVAQAVMTTNTLSDTGAYELIQRLRVPVQVRLRWVELAFGPDPRNHMGDPGWIGIMDAMDGSAPPTTLPPFIAIAGFANCDLVTGAWYTHYDFDHMPMLEPGHDYWLWVRVRNRYRLYSRTLTGSEGPAFTSNIDGYFGRTTDTGAWTQIAGQAMCFRMIGDPLGVLDVPAPPLKLSGLHLGVSPNPTHGGAFVIWSGASGAVRFDVLDARGRRVGGGTSVEGAEGRWLWRGAHDDGRRLPAGVYFVRASDAAGHVAIERAVLVR